MENTEKGYQETGEKSPIERWKVELEELESLARGSLPQEAIPEKLSEHLSRESIILLQEMMAEEGRGQYYAAKAKETGLIEDYYQKILESRKKYYDLMLRCGSLSGNKVNESLGRLMLQKMNGDEAYEGKVVNSALERTYGSEEAVLRAAAKIVSRISAEKTADAYREDRAPGRFEGQKAAAMAFAQTAVENDDTEIARLIYKSLANKFGDAAADHELRKLDIESQ